MLECIVVFDFNKECNVICEVNLLGIMIIVLIDIDCDFDFVDFFILGNDDGICLIDIIF